MISGKTFRHFKGGLYEGVCEAEHSEDEQVFVIYRDLSNGRVFARPREMFFEMVERGGSQVARFQEEEYGSEEC